MKTILRQVEAPVKYMGSRWVPASNYRIIWSFIAGQWSNMKKIKKNCMNEYPIARMKTILRQVEAPVKHMGFRWVPASTYSVECKNNEK